MQNLSHGSPWWQERVHMQLCTEARAGGSSCGAWRNVLECTLPVADAAGGCNCTIACTSDVARKTNSYSRDFWQDEEPAVPWERRLLEQQFCLPSRRPELLVPSELPQPPEELLVPMERQQLPAQVHMLRPDRQEGEVAALEFTVSPCWSGMPWKPAVGATERRPAAASPYVVTIAACEQESNMRTDHGQLHMSSASGAQKRRLLLESWSSLSLAGHSILLASWERAKNLKTETQEFAIDWFDPKTYIEAKVTGLAEETMLTDYYPIYIIFHSIVALAFWSVLAFIGRGQDEDSWLNDVAGLDHLPGLEKKTILQVHTLEGKDLRYELWRPLSYQFTHVGCRHVLINVFLNLVFGIPQEGFHGHWRMALIYNFGVIGGAFCYMVSDCHASVVGMSGGTYALIGLKWANLTTNWFQKRFRRPQLCFLLTLAGTDLWLTQLDVSGDSGARPSHSAHVGGFVAGLVFGVIYGRKIYETRGLRFYQCFLILIGLGAAAFGAYWTLKWPPQTIWEKQGWRWARRVSSVDVFGDRKWHCVRCGSQQCIDSWMQQNFTARTTVSWCRRNGGWVFTEDWPGRGVA